MENLITAIVRAEHNRGIVAGIRNSLRALQERPLPFAIERLWFGPKEAQEHQEWPARCRQPIGFPRPARRIALNAQVHRGDLGDLESLPVVRTPRIVNRLRRELGPMSDIVLPPVLPPANYDGPPNARNAFWSLTMYELPSRLLVANSLNRYLINSPMLPDLKRDADGGLTLYTGGDKGPGARIAASKADHAHQGLPGTRFLDSSRRFDIFAATTSRTFRDQQFRTSGEGVLP